MGTTAVSSEYDDSSVARITHNAFVTCESTAAQPLSDRTHIEILE